MISRQLIERLACTACGSAGLTLGSGRRPELLCPTCEHVFPIVDDIVDMTPPHAPKPGDYRTDTVPDVVGGMVDLAAPLMSAAVWHCSPIRYVDVEHRALGRANPGVFLEAPIGTGIVLDRVLSDYHDVCVIGVDSSWKMLRKAAKRFAGDSRVHLVRGRLDALPLRDDCIDSMHSLNGLNGVTEREQTLSEFRRVVRNDGFVSGTALIRGQELLADVVLDRYERWGVLPMLRTPEFLVAQMKACGLDNVRFETHGAVLFYSATA